MRIVEVVTTLLRACGEILDDSEPDEPAELFHYTDVGGLLGILGNKGELWATDVRCMNDTWELTLGSNLIKEASATRAAHPAHALFERLLEHPSYVSGLVFVVSFSTEKDLLSQWRAYADDGAGFALGIVPSGLRQLTLNGKLVSGSFLVRVEYDPSRQRRREERLVDAVLAELQRLSSHSLSDQDDQLLSMALGFVLPTFVALCKNRSFSEEAEYRLVLRSHQDPILPASAEPELTTPRCDFRPGRYGVTPFVKLHFSEGTLTDALSRIVNGPRQSTPDTESKVRTLLANAGVKHWSSFPIDTSAASYR